MESFKVKAKKEIELFTIIDAKTDHEALELTLSNPEELLWGVVDYVHLSKFTNKTTVKGIPFIKVFKA